MDAGEGVKIVAIFAAVASTGALLLIGAAHKWKREIDGWPIDDADHDAYDRRDSVAEALVPEFAAARMGADLTRGCGCRACRKRRDAEPCSDYDGD